MSAIGTKCLLQFKTIKVRIRWIAVVRTIQFEWLLMAEDGQISIKNYWNKGRGPAQIP
jgi:hypothetical protein